MGFWAIVTCVSTAAAAFVAIGYTAYVIYEYTHSTESPHRKGGQPSKPKGSGDFVTYEEMKSNSESEGTVLRHRHVGSNTPKSDDPSNTLYRDNPSDTSRSDEKIVIASPLENRECQETSTCDLSSVMSDDTASVCSFESDITLNWDDNTHCTLPTWNEMSDNDKRLTKCRACESPVETVAIPCYHPYMCIECAKTLILYYPRCPLSDCGRRLEDYRNID